jgi:hypothetical protein
MRLMTASSRSIRKSRGRGLPACGFGVTEPISTKAKTQPQQRVGRLRALVKTRRHPDRVGKIQAEGAHRQFRIVRRGRIGGSSRRPWIAMRCASSGSNQRSSGSEKASKARITA